MQREPSQFVSQVRNQIYPIIERLNDEKQQNLQSYKSKRDVNKAIYFLESGLDKISKAFDGSKRQKKLSRSWDESGGSQQQPQQKQTYRRQTSEVS